MDKILRCHHLNETSAPTSLAERLYIGLKKEIKFLLQFEHWPLLGVRSESVT